MSHDPRMTHVAKSCPTAVMVSLTSTAYSLPASPPAKADRVFDIALTPLGRGGKFCEHPVYMVVVEGGAASFVVVFPRRDRIAQRNNP